MTSVHKVRKIRNKKLHNICENKDTFISEIFEKLTEQLNPCFAHVDFEPENGRIWLRLIETKMSGAKS